MSTMENVSFNKSVVENYDKVISTYVGKDISVTAIVLNDWNDAHPELVHAGTAKSSSANYYMFNTKTQEGFETTRAIFAFWRIVTAARIIIQIMRRFPTGFWAMRSTTRFGTTWDRQI